MSRLRRLSLPCLAVLASCAVNTSTTTTALPAPARNTASSIGELRQAKIELTDVKIDSLINRAFYTPPEFDALMAAVGASSRLWSPQSFGEGDSQIVVVELKPND